MVKLTDIFFALVNPNRLNIYKLVLNKKMNVTEITKATKQKYPNVLKNLKILEDAGMITQKSEITPKGKETKINGLKFKEGSVYSDVYLKILEESKH